ncbi:MAG: isoprenyl transferase, partial [Armatimonadetes bacterium CG_4_10_14_0_8_um_filter_66_14]
MDGNGRWARRFTLPRLDGHRRGAEVVEGIVDVGRALGVQVITLYSFSTENWRRPKLEVATLMQILKGYLKKMVPAMQEKGVRLEAIGALEELPKDVQETLAWARAATA